MGTSGFTGVLVRAILFALWLPVVVLVVSLLRFGLEGMVTMDAMSLVQLVVFGWPSGIPLTLAVLLLYRRVQLLAYVCAVVLAPFSVLAFILGGLFGPFVLAYALVVSLPAWVALGIVALLQSRRS
jgi:hypothetical protein